MAALVVVLGIFMCKLNVVRVGQGGCGSKANFRSGRCQQRDRPARSEPFWVQACTATSKGVCASCWAVRWRAEEVSVGQGRGRARRIAADGRTGTCGAWLEPSLRVPDGEAALLYKSVIPPRIRFAACRRCAHLTPLPGHLTGPRAERLPPASRALQ